mmetsp:Transcript_15672/g.37766  ORF Transcript_15672/g.37766 Transcript_15672/m.37766 type:complete len:333 (-) Transcript_15672:125-1123(-)
MRLWVVLAAVIAAYFEDDVSYLVMSSPERGRISFLRIEGGNPTGEAEPIVDAGLQSPFGLAIDQGKSVLYVADPQAEKIFSIPFRATRGRLEMAGTPSVAVANTVARWVAVDHLGNLYYTEENPNNAIFKVQSAALDRHLRGSQLKLHDGAVASGVSQPGGINSDGFYVYWGNKDSGKERGSVVRGNARQVNTAVEVDRNLAPMSKSSDTVYGVCTTADNLFYSDSDGVVWGVKKTGGRDAEVSGDLLRPRSCAWDGDGTVYVADMGVENGVGQKGGAIYAFPGSMRSIGPQRMTKMVDFENAFGLALVHAGSVIATLPAAFVVVMAMLIYN